MNESRSLIGPALLLAKSRGVRAMARRIDLSLTARPRGGVSAFMPPGGPAGRRVGALALVGR